ncbi:MAG TPA: MFS transporter, partial [Gemmatimonadales bacterium]|nr:MFS transporter [Gemmatimonadales bacterium]
MTAPAGDADPRPPGRSPAVRLGWIAAVAFASGFPFGFFNELLPVYLRAREASLAQIGLLYNLSLPWALKFLWAPFVDRVGTRGLWIALCQVGLAGVFLGLFAREGAIGPGLFAIVLLLVALSATQDIAVDAYTIELVERRELGPANGVRVTAYRAGMILAGGALVAASARFGWEGIFVAAAALFLALAALTLTLPVRQRAPGAHTPIVEPLRELLARPASGGLVLFVLTFKLGDLALTPMVKPFWLDSGYSVETIGWVQTTLGIGASIVGALAGGWATARMGVFRGLWVLGLTQAASNLGYFAAAAAGAPPGLMYGAAIVEQFTQGLGTAAFVTFLMTICSRRHAATQFALLSALYRLGGIAAADVSGFLAERLGYASYFLVTFALALPGFAFLAFVRRSL